MTGRSGLVVGWITVAVALVLATAGPLAFQWQVRRIQAMPGDAPEAEYRLQEVFSTLTSAGVVAVGITLAVTLAAHAVRHGGPPAAVIAVRTRVRGGWTTALLVLAAVAALAVAGLVHASLTDTAFPPMPGSVRAPELAADTARDALFPALATAAVVLVALGLWRIGADRRHRLGPLLAWLAVAGAMVGGVAVQLRVIAVQNGLIDFFGSRIESSADLQQQFFSVGRLWSLGPAIEYGALLAALLLLAAHAARHRRRRALRDAASTPSTPGPTATG